MHFEFALRETLRHEGGYANDPDDRGGETFRGISRKFHPRWKGWSRIDELEKSEYIKNRSDVNYEIAVVKRKNRDALLEKYYAKRKANQKKYLIDHDAELIDQANEFYKKNYWDKVKISMIKSRTLASEIFDTAVNQGRESAIKYLQESLNLLNKNEQRYKDLKIDGVLGPVTAEIANKFPFPKALIKCMNGLQFVRYYNIVKSDKSQEKFMLGWLNRV